MMKKQSKNPISAAGLVNLYEAPGHLIRRCQQIAVAIFFDELKAFKITPVQYSALIAIRANPGVDQTTLVQLIAVDRTTIGTILNRMEKRELIRRVTPSHNRLVRQVFLLPAGKSLLRNSSEALKASQQRILAPLSTAERQTFIKLLSKVVLENNQFSRAPLRVQAASDDRVAELREASER